MTHRAAIAPDSAPARSSAFALSHPTLALRRRVR